jgi:hypothetical protein
MKTIESKSRLRIRVLRVAETYADLECDVIEGDARIAEDGEHPWTMLPALEALGIKNPGSGLSGGFERGYATLGRFWLTRWDLDRLLKEDARVEFDFVEVYEQDDDEQMDWQENRIENIQSVTV